MKRIADIGGGVYSFKCPGCGNEHQVHTKSKNKDGAQWTFSGTLDNPTFTPSINWRSGMYAKDPDPEHHAMLVKEKLGDICHFFLTNSVLAFCSDSTHRHANKKLYLQPIKTI